MIKPNNVDELAQQWERGVEEAREIESRMREKQPLGSEALDSAAGLNVKTRARAGLSPTQDVRSSYCCTGHNCL